MLLRCIVSEASTLSGWDFARSPDPLLCTGVVIQVWSPFSPLDPSNPSHTHINTFAPLAGSLALDDPLFAKSKCDWCPTSLKGHPTCLTALFCNAAHLYIHTAVILNSWDQNFVFHVNSLWLSSVLFVQVWPADPLFTWQSASNSGVCGTLIGVIWRRSGVPAHRKYLPGTDYLQAVGGVHLFPLGHSLIVGVGTRYHRIADITEIFTKERHNS